MGAWADFRRAMRMTPAEIEAENAARIAQLTAAFDAAEVLVEAVFTALPAGATGDDADTALLGAAEAIGYRLGEGDGSLVIGTAGKRIDDQLKAWGGTVPTAVPYPADYAEPEPEPAPEPQPEPEPEPEPAPAEPAPPNDTWADTDTPDWMSEVDVK